MQTNSLFKIIYLEFVSASQIVSILQPLQLIESFFLTETTRGRLGYT